MSENGTPIRDDNAIEEVSGPSRGSIGTARLSFCILLISSGTVLGGFSLLLVTNALGNTDTVGLMLLGFSAWAVGTGISLFFLRFPAALLVGLLAAPAAIVSVVVLYWLLLVLTAVANA